MVGNKSGAWRCISQDSWRCSKDSDGRNEVCARGLKDVAYVDVVGVIETNEKNTVFFERVRLLVNRRRG